MTDDLTLDRVEHLLDQWEKDVTNGNTYIPVQNAQEVVEVLRALRDRMRAEG